MIQQLIDNLAALQAQIRRSRAINVNSWQSKSGTIELATRYFTSYRPVLVNAIRESETLKAHDAKWQDLVRLAQGNNMRRSYIRLIGTIEKELKEFSIISLSRASEGEGENQSLSPLTPSEKQLVSTLEALLPTAAASYRQGILDLRQGDRLSYRGTACELREALRETLDHLAPDDDVMNQSGFKLDDGQKKPTMKQKARFVMNSRGRSKTQRDVAEKSISGVESLTGELVRATYDRASLATHLETTRIEVQRIKRYVDTVLFDLLEVS